MITSIKRILKTLLGVFDFKMIKKLELSMKSKMDSEINKNCPTFCNLTRNYLLYILLYLFFYAQKDFIKR